MISSKPSSGLQMHDAAVGYSGIERRAVTNLKFLPASHDKFHV
jgi:hypothetical protein